jgi:hypothetical protein
VIAALIGLLLATSSAADAAPTRKKAIWGPVRVNGVSQFPIYRDLGAGIWETTMDWSQVAPTRPARPRDPSDPAYRWPAELDDALRQAARHRMRVLVLIFRAPRWANGGRSHEWAPKRPRDFADFAQAASRRYRRVKFWMIWGEPSRRENFKPLRYLRFGRRVGRRATRGPRLYARILDAAYARLKRVDKRDLVVGGNTFTTGDVPPLLYVKLLRLPNGKPPRMDLYGHNPFTARRPNLRRPPLGYGYADFSDLDTLARYVDRYLRRPRRRRRLRFFLSEFMLPTDHPNYEFNFHVTRRTQARWLAAALRITRRWSRIYSLGWFSLYDEPPNRRGDEVNRGLLDYRGRRKPAYYAFRRG